VITRARGHGGLTRASGKGGIPSLFQCAVDAQDFSGEVSKTHPATFAPPVAAGATAFGNECG
jgi:hypothetical protein